MKVDIFVSYARDDLRVHPQILMVEKAFSESGYAVWRDDKLPAGEAFPYELAQTIEAARLVVVFWARASVQSRWVYEEADRGKRANKLLPVLLEQVAIPMGFGLLQAVPLAGWKGDLSSPMYKKLWAEVVQRLGPPPAAHEVLKLLPAVQELAMNEYAFGFTEAAELDLETPIDELLQHQIVDAEEGENEREASLWQLIFAIADQARFEPPDCAIPVITTLGELLQFLAPYTSHRQRPSGVERLTDEELLQLIKTKKDSE